MRDRERTNEREIERTNERERERKRMNERENKYERARTNERDSTNERERKPNYILYVKYVNYIQRSKTLETSRAGEQLRGLLTNSNKISPTINPASTHCVFVNTSAPSCLNQGIVPAVTAP